MKVLVNEILIFDAQIFGIVLHLNSNKDRNVGTVIRREKKLEA
jgi:hypothetical protein